MQSKFTHYKKPQNISDNWSDVVSGLVSLRHKQGISQEALADKIGCTSSLVHKWEQYKRVPSNFLFICWLDALNAKVEIKTKSDRRSTNMPSV